MSYHSIGFVTGQPCLIDREQIGSVVQQQLARHHAARTCRRAQRGAVADLSSQSRPVPSRCSAVRCVCDWVLGKQRLAGMGGGTLGMDLEGVR